MLILVPILEANIHPNVAGVAPQTGNTKGRRMVRPWGRSAIATLYII
jgi:hypothetical protein